MCRLRPACDRDGDQVVPRLATAEVGVRLLLLGKGVVVTDQWLVIPKWDEFQHYKNRDPAWIKLHRSLSSDPEWQKLSGHDRAVLVGLWLEYASSNCRVRVDTRSITRRLALRVTTATLERLNHAGFIDVSASKPLAQCYSRGREEKETPYPLKEVKAKQANGHTKKCPICGISISPPTTVADHLHLQHDVVTA